MIHAIITIAQATFKETVRDRILWTLGVFSLLLIGSSVLLGSISLDQDSRIIIDLGLTGIFIFGVIITLFLGGTTISRELDQRTAYAILARPIKRSWFILGKFVGLAATITAVVTLMSLVYLAVVISRVGIDGISVALVLALVYIVLELLVFVSLMLLFSSFSSSILSVVYGLAIFIIGHSTATIVQLIRDSSDIVKNIFIAAYFIFPNFQKFNLRNDAVYHQTPSGQEIAFTVAYAALYCAISLALAQAAFKKHEL